MEDMKKLEKNWLPEKSSMIDDMGRPITQSLFLETTYSDTAIYSLKENDWVYKGKLYPSIKQLYLALEDTTEFEFANRYFVNWAHWQRIVNNKALTPHIMGWREELALKLKARGIKKMMEKAEEGNYNAIKWLTDEGWIEAKRAGRPSKEDIKAAAKKMAKSKNEFQNDYARLMAVK